MMMVMRLGSALLLSVLLPPCFAQAPRTPNIEAQRAAMRKLAFVVGKWSGISRLYHESGEPLELIRTEEAQYKLDGLVLLIEGMGQEKRDGKVISRALAIISYDDASETYRMRAYNDGRYFECDPKLLDAGNGFTWELTFGQIKTRYVMRINRGEWTEIGEALIGSHPPRKFWEVAVRPER